MKVKRSRKQLQWYGHVQENGRGEIAKGSYEMASTRKKKTRKI
jgi:hypothetical protein